MAGTPAPGVGEGGGNRVLGVGSGEPASAQTVMTSWRAQAGAEPLLMEPATSVRRG